MSFIAPLGLLVLFAVPLALIAHVAAGRRRRRYPVRFPALATLAAVAAPEPRWSRHLPFALLALALAALAISLARPEKTVQVAVERASVVLVTDISRSMSATDVSPTRLEAARGAADRVAADARRLRVPIYTVALGTPNGTIELQGRTLRVPPDPDALERIATASGGQAFRAEDSDQLDAVYDRLGSQIGTKPEKREITTTFAGLALLLLGGAVASSLALGGRLP